MFHWHVTGVRWQQHHCLLTRAVTGSAEDGEVPTGSVDEGVGFGGRFRELQSVTYDLLIVGTGRLNDGDDPLDGFKYLHPTVVADDSVASDDCCPFAPERDADLLRAQVHDAIEVLVFGGTEPKMANTEVSG
jgi:hypothetical protein